MLQLQLKCLFFRTRVINKQIISTLVRILFPNIQCGKSDWAALQKWALASYRDYNMVLRRDLRELVSDFVKKYR